jgi:arylsulfatase A-like enzyme
VPSRASGGAVRGTTRLFTRRQILKAGLYGTAAAGVAPLLDACGGGYRGPARHVIWISLDTTRPDHFACYQDSWVRTPRISGLARESILFMDHITPVTTTLASHTSLFTGKYPHNHGVPRNGFMVNLENVMLPEILKRAGFHTAGFLGSFALDRRFDFAQGFDDFNQDFDILYGDSGADQNQRRAAAVTQAVIDYLDRGEAARNRFLFVHYFDPHQPYMPPAPFDTLYGGAQGLTVPDPARHPVLRTGRRTLEYELPIQRYAGETTYMDAEVGRLLDALKTRGMLDETLLIVTSDHGENLSDAPAGRPFDHGNTVYEPEIKALCMVRLPGGQRGGTQCTMQTSHIDLLPTLTRYLGLPTPDRIDGLALDLTGALAATGPRVLFAEATKPWNDVETDPRWYNLLKPRCARRGSYKYIQTVYQRSEELYDLARDPFEHDNLLRHVTPASSTIASELRQAMSAWTASAHPLPSSFESSQRQETTERLKSLGYL